VQEIATEPQGGEECVGKEGAEGVEKAGLKSGADVDQVCGKSLDPAALLTWHSDIGRMGWSSTGNYKKGDSPKETI
jgi:hypothetical protein